MLPEQDSLEGRSAAIGTGRARLARAQKIALCLEYDGSRFHGWQYQQGLRSVEGELRAACLGFQVEMEQLVCAGRTDSGVHCLNQIISFRCEAQRPPRAWLLGLNRQLPTDIRVRWMRPVRDDFNARACALARRYVYLIYNSSAASALWRQRASAYPWPLDADDMQRASKCLVGEHDFQSFRGRHCQSLTSWRRVDSLKVYRRNSWVVIDIEANAFLHHMVRNIVGSLLVVGRGQRDAAWLQRVLTSRDRRVAASTAPAAGLYLAQVSYPSEFGLPEQVLDLWWM